MTYGGYLSQFNHLIVAGHRAGHSTREIATALFKLGARSCVSHPDSSRLTADGHISRLMPMVVFAQIRWACGSESRARRRSSRRSRAVTSQAP
jgi:hypothetical protein